MAHQCSLLGQRQTRGLQLKALRGFTLIELMVTISVVAILLALVMPSVGQSIATSRARSVVYEFKQDFASLRGVAATNPQGVTMTLNADCSWSASVGGVADTQHSQTSAQVSSMLGGSGAGFTCASGLPKTFTFSAQGFVSPAATISFTSASGQTWTLNVLTSGTIM